ncbi:hypothetical protein [Desulfovibrio sp. JC010]|uniref:hypothetical protein n=1 Tax=Desulfovibrio sp. JC010 TaxID=2593641 RepID=UPI0013D17763|nr:hypothetical protein [Desulfovibrio sp. JC010]NDV26441.1 hypothetical protein [Desulfovibrio sp. JC010]
MLKNSLKKKARTSLLTICSIAFCFAILGLSPTPPACADDIIINLREESLNSYFKLISEFDNDPLKIKHIPFQKYKRGPIEIAIIIKALRLGGLTDEIKFKVIPNSNRQIKDTADGKSVICGQQLPISFVEMNNCFDKVFMSAPITNYGEFQKLFYYLPENHKMKNITFEKLKNKTKGAIGIDWYSDITVFNAIGITNYITGQTTLSVIKMLKAGRADWVPIVVHNTDDFSTVTEGVKLIPVQGLKFALPETRHFFISRKHPMGKEVYAALQKGLKILRENYFLRDALYATGFFTPRIDSWEMLNADQIEHHTVPHMEK